MAVEYTGLGRVRLARLCVTGATRPIATVWPKRTIRG